QLKRIVRPTGCCQFLESECSDAHADSSPHAVLQPRQDQAGWRVRQKRCPVSEGFRDRRSPSNNVRKTTPAVRPPEPDTKCKRLRRGCVPAPDSFADPPTP